MDTLIEKRQEIAAKLSKLLAEREESIKAKINAYCAQLEAEPMSVDIINAQKCIKALDDVISYESMMNDNDSNKVEGQVQAEVAPIESAKIEVTTEAKPEAKTETIIVDNHGHSFNTSEGEEARPGMAYIGIPERR